MGGIPIISNLKCLTDHHTHYIEQRNLCKILFTNRLRQENILLIVNFIADVKAYPVFIRQAESVFHDRLDAGELQVGDLFKKMAQGRGLFYFAVYFTITF